MGEKGRELCGLERSQDKSLMVFFGDEVVVVVAHNAMTMNDFAAADDVEVAVGLWLWLLFMCSSAA